MFYLLISGFASRRRLGSSNSFSFLKDSQTSSKWPQNFHPNSPSWPVGIPQSWLGLGTQKAGLSRPEHGWPLFRRCREPGVWVWREDISRRYGGVSECPFHGDSPEERSKCTSRDLHEDQASIGNWSLDRCLRAMVNGKIKAIPIKSTYFLNFLFCIGV